jgi:hypothetical protein
MLIERSTIQARVFNLDDVGDHNEYNSIINDPAIRILDKKWIDHTEVEAEGRNRSETKENHIYLEWETCSL